MSATKRGAGAPARERPEGKTRGAIRNPILTVIVRLFTVLVEMLREIFDESAYQRFLERGDLQSTPRAYAIFQQETEQSKSRRPRCC